MSSNHPKHHEKQLMDSSKPPRQIVSDLFASQIQAVLATQNDRQPYTSLMAFAATADLKKLLFATYRATHKYNNLSHNPRAALLIDNRSNRSSDHYDGLAVTAVGTTHEVAETERETFLNLYLQRHPGLKEFVTSPACALMAMNVECYYIVSKFQEVTELPV